MTILFTVCGRAGSKGFKNKNLKKMNGVPLVYYTLAAISLYKERHPEDKTIVALNTDSELLVELVQSQSKIENIKFVSRKEELAGDKTAKIEVIKDTFLKVSREESINIVVDLDLTSPLRTVDDIENCIREYQTNENYDLVTSVVPARRSPYFNMVEKKGDFYRKICESNFTARQEAPASYELNASIYVYRPSFLEADIENTILDNRCGVSIMKDYLVLDIDSEEDFVMMEFLHRYYTENDSGIKEVYETAERI